MTFHLPFVLLLAVPAMAQVALRVEAATDLRVRCAGTIRQIPVGTDLTSGVYLGADGSNCQQGASARVSVVPGTSVQFANIAYSTAQFGCVSDEAECGTHSIRVHFSANQPTSGTLRVTMTHAQSLGGFWIRATANGSVNVGADGIGVSTGANPQTFERSVTLGPTPLPVLISAYALGFGTSASTNITVSFVGDGRVRPDGQPCGPTLIGTVLSDPLASLLSFHVRNAAVVPNAFLVLGVQPLGLSIPPTGCLLRTDIVLPIWVPIGWDGRATLGYMLSPQFALSCHAQFLVATDVAGVTHWHTSERLTVRLP